MNQTIKLDTRKRDGTYGEARIAPLRRGERNNALLTVKVCANGQPYDLAGKTVSLVATTAAGKLVGPCPMEVAEAGIARIMLPAALYSAVGSFRGYVEIRDGDTLVDTTDRFGGKVIECADLDSEQAEEFTPLLGELQNAVAEEAKRVEAEKARSQAETERETGFAEAKQAAQTATTAANDAAAGARSAAGSASDAAESANTAAGKANDAATKAVTDAKAAIADVKATEAKLYPVAENVLKGKVKDTFVHVDDAFPSSLLGIEVEGACRQDGTPSPDNPVPIEVVEHPVVQVRGRNLLNTEPLSDIRNFDTSQINRGFLVYKFTLPSRGDYTVSVRRTSREGLFLATDTSGQYDGNTAKWFSHPSVILYTNVIYKDTDVIYLFFSSSLDGVKKVIDAVGGIQIEKGSTVTALEPYISQSQSFTLPAEHPYLAKFPDGTADEIVVDRDGNVSLVARVGKAVNAKILSASRAGELDNTNGVSIYGSIFDDVNKVTLDGIPKASGAAYCDKLYSAKVGTENVTNAVYKPQSDVFVVNIAGAKDENDAKAKFDALESVVYAPIVEKHYQLGKIEMPKAQDSITNVWTDAEVTPKTDIEYTRDVNIVVSNLESAIASITEG